MPLPLNLILFTCLRERKTDMTIVEKIRTGKTYLGIELGSTRIKACLIDDEMKPIASGAHEWKNRFENGYWTYSLDDIHNGIRSCYASLLADVKEKYGVCPETYGAMGVSAMMHGIDKLICYITQCMTLLPGDIIATGTPSGIGSMQRGDTVEVRITGLGTLRNIVR